MASPLVERVVHSGELAREARDVVEFVAERRSKDGIVNYVHRPLLIRAAPRRHQSRYAAHASSAVAFAAAIGSNPSMVPNPLALCLEDLDEPDPARAYLCCVAVPGRGPGLRVAPDGRVVWCSTEAVGAELWVSADARLILFRPADASRVGVDRAERHLDVPAEKPVVLLAGDVVSVGARRLRVHVHGAATAIAPPSPYVAPAEIVRGIGKAALQLASALALASCIDVLVAPPEPPMPPPPPPIDRPDAGAPPGPPSSPAPTTSPPQTTAATPTKGM